MPLALSVAVREGEWGRVREERGEWGRSVESGGVLNNRISHQKKRVREERGRE